MCYNLFMDESPKRPRGAPPGNRNAVTHGFYARQLHGLSGPVPGAQTLSDEIVLLRLAIREMTGQDPATLTAKAELELLRAMTIAAGAINRLVRARNAYGTLIRKPDSAAPEPMAGLTAEDQDTASRVNVDGEIALLQHLTQRVLARRGEYDTPKLTAAMVRALAYANTTLTSLVRTQKKMTSAHSPLNRLLREMNEHSRRIEQGEFDEE